MSDEESKLIQAPGIGPTPLPQHPRWLILAGAILGLIVGNGPIMQFTLLGFAAALAVACALLATLCPYSFLPATAPSHQD